jgi:hypothetical protein
MTSNPRRPARIVFFGRVLLGVFFVASVAVLVG